MVRITVKCSSRNLSVSTVDYLLFFYSLLCQMNHHKPDTLASITIIDKITRDNIIISCSFIHCDPNEPACFIYGKEW